MDLRGRASDWPSEQSVRQAWAWAGRHCPCPRVDHGHPALCGRPLAWRQRGASGPGGWEARGHVALGGAEYCEILCYDCFAHPQSSEDVGVSARGAPFPPGRGTMLRNTSTLEGFTVGATDGDVGRVIDFYFDDESWTVRHLVVDTGGWLPGREVLLSPLSLRRVDWDNSRIVCRLSRQQVEQAPSIDTHRPISRGHEREYYDYYGMPYYWSGPYRWGAEAMSASDADHEPQPRSGTEVGGVAAETDQHLQSARTVTGYYIEAEDGNIGHVEDFLVDDVDWAIRYMIVDTRNWLPGKKVLVSPDWIDQVSWADSTVYVDVSRDRIKTSPEYDPSRPIEREYESSLWDYYGRRRYWERDRAA